MAISRKQIVSTHSDSHSAVDCMADFIVEQLLADKLSDESITQLLELIKKHYNLAKLEKEEIIALLKYFYSTPAQYQQIIGNALLSHLETHSDAKNIIQNNGSLTDKAFAPIAHLLKFNVQFHIEEKGSETITPFRDDHLFNKMNIKVGISFPTLNIYDSSTHTQPEQYRLIMPTINDAKKHAIAEAKVASRLLDHSDPVRMKQQIKTAIISIQTSLAEEKKPTKKVAQNTTPAAERKATPAVAKKEKSPVTEGKKASTGEKKIAVTEHSDPRDSKKGFFAQDFTPSAAAKTSTAMTWKEFLANSLIISTDPITDKQKELKQKQEELERQVKIRSSLSDAEKKSNKVAYAIKDGKNPTDDLVFMVSKEEQIKLDAEFAYRLQEDKEQIERDAAFASQLQEELNRERFKRR